MLADTITGFVLAGGRSTRMGRDKAHIPWTHGTLLIHAVEELSQVALRVFIVGARNVDDPPVSVIEDSLPGRGPLAGVHAALGQTATDWNLFLAVDLPFVTGGLLGLVAGYCPSSASLAIVPKVGGKLQPLCAAYHRNLLPEVESALNAGEFSIHRLLERLSTGIIDDSPPGKMYVIEEQELQDAGFASEMLLNVNTPEDLERARALVKTLNV